LSNLAFAHVQNVLRQVLESHVRLYHSGRLHPVGVSNGIPEIRGEEFFREVVEVPALVVHDGGQHGARFEKGTPHVQVLTFAGLGVKTSRDLPHNFLKHKVIHKMNVGFLNRCYLSPRCSALWVGDDPDVIGPD
jgi:hypothetical protein